MSTRDPILTGLPDAVLLEAIQKALQQHDRRLDEVTTVEVLSLLQEALKIDRAELKRHKRQIDQKLLTAYGRIIPPDKLSDHVYLGSEWNATNKEELQRLNIKRVVNCTLEDDVGGVPSPFEKEITYMRLPQPDNMDASLVQYWDDVYAFIKEAEQEGSAVLVHCQRGISRSAATCVAYFMRDKGWSKGEAYDHVRRCRPLIQPNPKFMRELDEYEARLFELQLIGAARAYGERARARERERLGQEGAS